MPQMSGSLVYPLLQDGDSLQRVVTHDEDRLRWCVFGGMVVSAMVIIVIGAVTQARGPWDWEYTSYAIV